MYNQPSVLSKQFALFNFRATLAAIGGFLEAFQKVADMATGSRGKETHPNTKKTPQKNVDRIYGLEMHMKFIFKSNTSRGTESQMKEVFHCCIAFFLYWRAVISNEWQYSILGSQELDYWVSDIELILWPELFVAVVVVKERKTVSSTQWLRHHLGQLH